MIVDAYGLTPTQAGILFHVLADPAGEAYLNHLEFEVTGPLDVAAFGAAFGWVIDRHPVLRSGFHWAEADEPLQVVHDRVAWRPEVHDLRHLAGETRRTAVRELFAARRAEPMDLATPPLLRLDLVRLAGDRTVGLWTYHHLVLDGWSLALVHADVLHRYRQGPAYDPPPPRLFREHVAWQRAARADGTAERYWSRELAGAGFTHLAVPSPAGGTGYGREVRTVPVAELAKAALVTPGVVLHAAWALTLARYAGTDHVVFGTATAGRPATTPGVEQQVGMFVNTVPVRAHVDRNATAGEFLRGQLAAQAERDAHDHLPLVEIRRLAGRTPGDELFGTLLAVENFPVPVDPVALDRDVTITLSRAVEHTHYPLTVTALPGPEWTIEAEYRRDQYAATVVAGLLDQLVHVVAELADLDRPLGRLAPLPPAQAAVVAGHADGGPDGGPAPDVVAAFLDRARCRPHAPAVVSSEDTLSYADLESRSAALAGWLCDQGVGLGATVAIRLDRTWRLPVAMLGVLRAGAAYLPIDVAAPAPRVEAMLAEATPALVLDAVLVDEALTHQAAAPPGDWPRSVPAYVIFTSGSTGTPKGVVVSRGALSDHIRTILAAYRMTADDRMLQIASPAFDLAVEEFFPAWAGGGAVMLAPSRLPDTVADFAAFLTRAGITVVNMAAAYWHRWVAELDRQPLPPSLRVASIGAEPVWTSETGTWLRHAGRSMFYNAYGVTEATITTTLYPAAEPLPDTAMLPIGRPLPGKSLALLDRHGESVPPGVIGELYIGGAGVATGYAGRAAATAERFLPDPAGPPGARRYRTGDLGHRLADGSVVLAGRADDQVKIRGHRVEPAEVEAVIAGHPAVAAAAVVVHPDPTGAPALVAYLVGAGDVGTDEIRADCEAVLAGHLRPLAWVPLAALPMLASGKVDRAALPAPDLLASRRAGDAGWLATGTQEWVADTWRDVLGGVAPGRLDRFFDLGGHSLTATQVVGRARRAFAIDLPIHSLLGNPTLAEFAHAVDLARRGGQGTVAPPLTRLPPGVAAPLSYTQERLWFLDRLDEGGAGYNITAAWRLAGELDVPRLRAALAAVVDRHTVLRTSYPHHGGVPTVRIRDRVPVDLPVRHCADEPAAVRAVLAAEAHQPFDLATGPLFRFGLLRLGPAVHVLVVNVHHIVFDGWSHAILMTELAARYDDPAAALPELPAQYPDFAAWQRNWLRGDRLAGLLDHWRQALTPPPPALELPTSRPRTSPARHVGGQHRFRVDAATHDAARTLARDTDSTLFVVLLAGFAALLHTYTGQDDLVIGTPVAGRLLPETEHLIGCFFTTLALRVRPVPGQSFRELAEAVRATAYAGYDHQEAPFEQVIEAAGVTRELDREPLAQVMFVFQNMPHRPLRLGGLTATTLTMPEPAKLDLILTMAEEDGGLVGLWEYNAALFDADAIADLTDSLGTLLAAATAEPDRPLRTLPLLSTGRRDRALRSATGPTTARPPATLPALVHAQATRTPHAPAVITHDGQAVDYATVDGRAGRVAGWLRGRGVRRGDRVAVRLPAGPDLLVALLGVLRAGAGYVPVDPALPPARVEQLCAEAGARLVLDSLAEAAGPALPVDSELAPDDLAYVLFTSGSTGRPKGVAVTHRNVTAYLRWFAEHYALTPADRTLSHLSVGFDLSVPTLFAPLLAGGAVVLADPDRRSDPRHLTDLIDAAGVSVVVSTPSVLRLLVDDGGLADCVTPRLVVTCGEPLPGDLVRALAGQTAARVDNQYGPTETTVAVTAGRADGRATGPIVPLGSPIDDCRVYLTDRAGRLVPPGVVGELWIGGAQVARGYHKAPGLTADRFRPDPWVPGARLYRTGDLARRRADGELEFLGRADRQLKVRGVRVEPGEVEAVLTGHPLVRQAAVIGTGDRLIAFVVPNSVDGDPELLPYLAARLPAYLVPAAVVSVADLPRTPNGKIDHAALAAHALPRPEPAEHRPPATPTEVEIAAIYAELLEQPEVGSGDDFFALGGQSLLAVRAVTRIRQRLGVDLPLRTLFTAPTVAALAREVDDLALLHADPRALAALLDEVGDRPDRMETP